MEKTNVMRILDQKKIHYAPHAYDPTVLDGVSVAAQLGQNKAQVFKTLVCTANTGSHYVFVVPVAGSLDLKRAARAVSVKSIAMLKQKELLPLTGYIHGGCSPVGMKKTFQTVIDKSALPLESMFVSAGKVGYQVELNPRELAGLIGADFADLVAAEGENGEPDDA